MDSTVQNSDFARIYDNIKYLQSHFLNYHMHHVPDGGGIMCKYCTGSIIFHEECEAGTKEVREDARNNIDGANLLISKLSEMSEEERKLILGFLNQCLQHHYH